jgi:hypothetical protein
MINTVIKSMQNKKITPILLGAVAVLELLFINELSDLRPFLSNWENKSREILNLSAPSDNLYGPGAAILLIPFIWNSPTFFAANLFYIFIGTIFYCKICQNINTTKYRHVAYLSLLFNPYLFWLCHSSQDTVLEFALLMVSIYFIISNKFFLFCIATLILSETRSQYWVFFLVASTIKIVISLKEKTKVKKVFYLPFVFLLGVMAFNQSNYGSTSITLFAGETLELGQSKYFYIAHPKFDADVMLGLASQTDTYRSTRAPENFTPAQKNKYYTDQAFLSIKENPKQAILNLMQRIDSYIFISQKVPNSPGKFILNKEGNQISIIDERLSWSLILGSLFYQLWRGLMLILLISSIAILLYEITTNKYRIKTSDIWLLLPWATTFFVIILFYMETRYKIVPELLLPVFSLLTISRLKK